MATIFRFRRNADEDGRTAGGKIMRTRRNPAAARTPYARPEPPPPPPEEQLPETSGNPNWLSGLIYPARAIASGAGKVFSAVFGPDSFSTSSSSSGGESDSEDENDDDVSPVTDNALNKVLSSVNTKREKMHLVQHLVMQETFSREECDELIKLIRSRVVKWDTTLSNPDVRFDAVMEARKWLEDKKAGSGSKSTAEDQLYTPNHGALSLVTESEIGSPVDVAKSYMQARPSWSSPSLKHVEFGTPSPTQNSKEDISKSLFHSSLQLPEMKTSALSAGSWNILDEIRRVRSKATEELLATTPSKKINLAFSLEEKSDQDTVTNNMNDVKQGDKLHNLTSLVSNSDLNAPEPATKDGGLPESVEMEYGLPGGVVQTNNASLVPKQAVGDTGASSGTDRGVTSEQLDGYPHSHDMNGLRNSTANDRPMSSSAADQTPESRDKEMIDAVDPGKDKVDGNIPEDKLELQNEHTTNHALHANENDTILSGSQDSSSMHYEESLQDVNQSSPKHKGKDTPPGRKLRPRKGKGRDK